MKRTLALLIILAVGCGKDGSGGGDPDAPATADAPAIDAAIDSPSGGAFALTSPMLANNAAFDAANTCTGVNTSPQLVWASPPAGTLSYAVVLTDMSNNLVHWVIYDIPASATQLPANVQKVYAPADPPGAHQTVSFQAGMRGYLGPCPPVQHTYQFVVYAISAATLPGATMQTNRAQAVTAIQANDLGSATLTGTYQQP